MKKAAIAWVLLTACNGKDSDTDTDSDTDADTDADTDTDTDTDAPEVVGDVSCFDGTWLTQDVDEAQQVTLSGVEGTVRDFESEDAVAGAKVEVYFDDAGGEPDLSAVSDSSGDVTFDLPACAPVLVRVEGGGQQTVRAHRVFDSSETDPIYAMLSATTYFILPSVFGVDVDTSEGLLIGSTADCAGAPVENAWVQVRNSVDKVVEADVRYFVDSFPDRYQELTSADGLWVAMNVPTGEVTVELWAVVEGEPTLIATSAQLSVAGATAVVPLSVGYEDVKYPDACLAAE